MACGETGPWESGALFAASVKPFPRQLLDDGVVLREFMTADVSLQLSTISKRKQS